MKVLSEIDKLLNVVKKHTGEHKQEVILIMERNGKRYNLSEWENNKRLVEVEDSNDKILIKLVSEREANPRREDFS